MSRLVSDSSINYSSSSISGKILSIVVLSPITILGKEYERLDVHVKMEETPICKFTTSYRDHRTWVLIYLIYFVA